MLRAITDVFFAMGALILSTSAGFAQAKPDGVCPANLTNFEPDTVMTCQCGADQLVGTVWGTDLYTGDSAVCAAALHAGLIDATGGIVTVFKQPGRDSYDGSFRNGVETLDYGSWGASFTFEGIVLATDPLCPANFIDPPEDPLVCQCDPAAAVGTVWGTDVYTNDSSICAAATHAGVIGPEGGLVRVVSLPGQDAYEGTDRNGIATASYGSWGGSFGVTAEKP